MMNSIRIINHKIINLLHTVILVAGMLVLLAVLGYFLAGVDGLIWATFFGMIILYLSQRVPAQIVLRMFGARPLSPQQAPRLYSILEQLASRAGLPTVPHLYLIPGRVTNALTIGSRQDAAIGVTEPLLQRLTLREVTAVLAHEVSHIRHNDMRVMSFAATIGRITSMFSVFGQILLFFNLPFLLTGRVFISWGVVFLLIAAPTLSSLLQLALARTREFDADIGAVRLTGDPEGMANALQKLAYANTNMLKRILWPYGRSSQTSIFRTHPRTEERIARLMSLSGDGRGHSLQNSDTPVPPRYVTKRPRRSRWHVNWLAN